MLRLKLFTIVTRASTAQSVVKWLKSYRLTKSKSQNYPTHEVTKGYPIAAEVTLHHT